MKHRSGSIMIWGLCSFQDIMPSVILPTIITEEAAGGERVNYKPSVAVKDAESGQSLSLQIKFGKKKS